jgi:hypothetical protein
MATKTFKIGEYSRSGVITATTTNDSVIISCREWDFSTGSRRSSNQNNAKEIDRIEVLLVDQNAERKLTEFLNEDTTHYYSEQVMDWVRTKAKLNKSLIW